VGQPNTMYRVAPVSAWRSRLTGEALRDTVLPVVSVAAFLLLWLLGYEATTFVPSPAEVFEVGRETLTEGETYAQIGLSLRRLVIGFAIGLLIGTLLSIQSTRSRWLAQVADTYVRIALTLPSLLVALLGLVIFGVSEAGAIMTVAVIVFPFITVPLVQGARSLDHRYQQMAHVYHFSTYMRLRHVAIPHMAPYFFSGIRNGHALGWKVLIVAEIFSVRSGIGQEFTAAFGLFNLPLVVVWLVIFLTVIGLIEYGVLGVVERRVFRWRQRA
jgi:NitT/TauT family transport system permease protein